jgi:hypothetical protein
MADTAIKDETPGAPVQLADRFPAQRDTGGGSWADRYLTAGDIVTPPPEDGITAHAGGGQGSATALSSTLLFHHVTVAATAGDSLLMPDATSRQPPHIVRNDGANAATLWGNASDTINGAASISVPIKHAIVLWWISANKWHAGFAVDPTLYAVLASAQSFTKAQRATPAALTDAATVALDLSLSNAFTVVLGGNRTLGAPTNAAENQAGSITVRQDATGSRTLAYAWPYVWTGGTAGTLSTAGCSIDQLVYEVLKWAASSVTITIASPGVVTWNAHGLDTGQRLQLTTTGALPTGLTASTTYFVIKNDANSFWCATSLANAAAGTKINTSGSQSGTHTATAATILLALNKAYA